MTPRRVTLTFDNGPDPVTTPVVLDTLADRGVRSTFFVVGEQLRSAAGQGLAARAVTDGHWIGNHTLTHTVPLGDLADPNAVRHEIDDTQALIGPLAHPDRLFRPFGRGGVVDRRLLGPSALDCLRVGGYTCVLWNCVPHDWDDPDGWVATALADVETRPWSVVVVHDLPTGAMDHLGEFLDRIADSGAVLTQDFPEECVPLRRGEPTATFATLPLPVGTVGGLR